MMKLILSAIVALAMMPEAQAGKPGRQKRGGPSEFIAAVVKTQEGGMEVWLNTREAWEKEGRLTDSYVEDGQMERADAITDATSLCNLMESTYEPCEQGGTAPQRSQKQIMRELQAIGVEIDPEFQAWAQHEIDS